MNPRHQGRRLPNFYRPPTTPGADFQCTARNTERPRPPPLVILLERLFLNSAPKDFWLSAIWPSLAASDGLALPSRGGDFRSRSSGERRRSFWEPREAPGSLIQSVQNAERTPPFVRVAYGPKQTRQFNSPASAFGVKPDGRAGYTALPVLTPSRPRYRNAMTQPSIKVRSWVPRSGSLRNAKMRIRIVAAAAKQRIRGRGAVGAIEPEK
jgi:hypothetical protein